MTNQNLAFSTVWTTQSGSLERDSILFFPRISKNEIEESKAMIEQVKAHNKQKGQPKILLVDDDIMFGRTFSRVAKKRNLDLTLCTVAADLKHVNRNEFDVAIIDYYLDKLHGTDVALVMGATPVILVSNLEEDCLEESDYWPPSIRHFMSKQQGMSRILSSAVSVFRNQRIRKPKE